MTPYAAAAAAFDLEEELFVDDSRADVVASLTLGRRCLAELRCHGERSSVFVFDADFGIGVL